MYVFPILAPIPFRVDVDTATFDNTFIEEMKKISKREEIRNTHV
jgi:hypothetical protein